MSERVTTVCPGCGGPADNGVGYYCHRCEQECDADYWDQDDDFLWCECGGSGWIVTCFDDLCVGAGWCMHGDGEKPCPGCNKDGDEPNPDARRP